MRVSTIKKALDEYENAWCTPNINLTFCVEYSNASLSQYNLLALTAAVAMFLIRQPGLSTIQCSLVHSVVLFLNDDMLGMISFKYVLC